MKPRQLLLASALGLGLTLTLLAALSRSPEVARAWPPGRTAGPAFVKAGEPMSSTSGYCTQSDPCGSIQYAINESEPGNGDTIYVAGGTYTGTGTAVITVTKSVTIYGGWDGNTGTVVVDPDVYLTILDAENGRRVAYITGTVAPVLEGLTLQRGNAAGLGGDPWMFDVGGAVYAYNPDVAITNCCVQSSTAQFGGGLALYHGAPTLGNSTVVSNTASMGGGGVYLDNTSATIANNTVMLNTTSGSALYNGGGGMYLNASPAVIRNNSIQGNHSGRDGGGLFLYQSGVLVQGNTIQDNSALAGDGGGVFMLESPAELEANSIFDNQANNGGGVDILGSNPFTLTSNLFALNATPGGPPALRIWGCQTCPGSPASQGTLLHNTFADNHSPPSPWQIAIGSSSGPGATASFTNTLVGTERGLSPGGIWVLNTGSVRMDTTLWDIKLGGLTISGSGTFVTSTDYYSLPFLHPETYHLSPGSLAIDLGTNAGVNTDVDGEPRPNGPLPDIGADEFYCYAPTGVTIAGPTQGVTNTTYAFTATISPPTATLPTTYTWQASGQPLTSHVVLNQPTDTMAFSWTIAGAKVVTVTAANCGGSVEDTHTIRISQWDLYLPLVLRGW